VRWLVVPPVVPLETQRKAKYNTTTYSRDGGGCFSAAAATARRCALRVERYRISLFASAALVIVGMYVKQKHTAMPAFLQAINSVHSVQVEGPPATLPPAEWFALHAASCRLARWWCVLRLHSALIELRCLHAVHLAPMLCVVIIFMDVATPLAAREGSATFAPMGVLLPEFFPHRFTLPWRGGGLQSRGILVASLVSYIAHQLVLHADGRLVLKRSLLKRERHN